MTATNLERELALKYALAAMPDEGHYGRSHGTGAFMYDPIGCPGCRRAILVEMQRELTPEPLRGRLVRS